MRSLRLQTATPPELTGGVPWSALTTSLLALVVAGVAGLAWPSALRDYSAMVWLLALIPSFLLAYYKGWRGAAIAFAAGMAVLMLSEVLFTGWLVDREPDWRLVGATVIALIAVNLGVGFLSQGHLRRRVDTLHFAYADPVTGLPNRRLIDFFLTQYFAEAQRDRGLTVIAFELYGIPERPPQGRAANNAAWEEGARRMADILAAGTRDTDISGRYEQREFVSLLPFTPLPKARIVAERMRGAVEASPRMRELGLTLVAGLAEYTPAMTDRSQLVDAARAAMHAARHAGGNCVRPSAEADSGPNGPLAAFVRDLTEGPI